MLRIAYFTICFNAALEISVDLPLLRPELSDKINLKYIFSTQKSP